MKSHCEHCQNCFIYLFIFFYCCCCCWVDFVISSFVSLFISRANYKQIIRTACIQPRPKVCATVKFTYFCCFHLAFVLRSANTHTHTHTANSQNRARTPPASNIYKIKQPNKTSNACTQNTKNLWKIEKTFFFLFGARCFVCVCLLCIETLRNQQINGNPLGIQISNTTIRVDIENANRDKTKRI